MSRSYQTTPLPPAQFHYADDDNRTRVSCDSLAYSDITGEPGTVMTAFSAESLRLNGHTWQGRKEMQPIYQPQRRPVLGDDHWFQQPRIRACFCLSVTLAVLTVVLLTSGVLDSEWIENIWEMGMKGALAQGMADASLIKTTSIASDGTAVYLGKSKKQEALSLTTTPPDGCETTIMLIRHCEKGNLRSHCNYSGFERAAYLATLFGNKDERWPAPDEIYALKAGGRGKKNTKRNFREVETVQYIANKHGLIINEDYKTSDDDKLVRNMLTSILNGEQCGKLTLVSWKHSDLAKLAQLLGCGPFEGCPMEYRGKEFDQVWQIKYVYRSFHHGPKATSTHKHWDIFGSVQYENFDPLAFSKSVGDYPKGGTRHGAKWVEPDQQLFD